MPTQKQITSLIKAAKPSVDLVIVSYHWGKEYMYQPNNLQVKRGHTAIDAGADLVIGHHPHCIESVEKYKGKWIVYSLGNFVFDQDFTKGTESLLFSCTLKKGAVENLSFQPIKINNCQPSIATGEDRDSITAKFTRICSEKGVKVTNSNGHLYLK